MPTFHFYFVPKKKCRPSVCQLKSQHPACENAHHSGIFPSVPLANGIRTFHCSAAPGKRAQDQVLTSEKESGQEQDPDCTAGLGSGLQNANKIYF